MSLIANCLLRSALSKKIYAGLRLQVMVTQIKPQNVCYVTTIATSKNAARILEEEPKQKMNNAAKIFMERAQEYDEMIELAGAEYRIGMRHLANMMGADPETFTQKDADVAIEYLFPSGLNDKKARPFMKPPEEVFPPRKKIQFDRTGRPFHHLFFTGFPNFYELCHEAVGQLRNLDKIEDKEIRQNKQPNEELQLKLDSSVWLTKEELQNVIIEDISDRQYDNFVTLMDRLAIHPYSYECKDYIFKYRKLLRNENKGRTIVEPKIGKDGRRYVTTYECRFKTCRADVTVIEPGTGKIEINGKDINYFDHIAPKETVSTRSLIQLNLKLRLNHQTKCEHLNIKLNKKELCQSDDDS